jgi:dephospho-CoA kinase
MLIVALTGGIATGKSVVAGVLKRRGCRLHSSDKAAHDLIRPGQAGWEPIVTRFGRGILAADGTIDRPKLGALIFADPADRAFLNGLLHPLVFDITRTVLRRLEAEGRVKIFVNEAALTIEAGRAEFYDKIVVTYCPPEIQIQRLMDRDGIAREAAFRKIDAQMPAEEKLSCADYIVDTTGSLEDTVAQAENLYEDLLLDYEIKRQDVAGRRRRA